jgi:CRISPR-associated protein Csb2
VFAVAIDLLAHRYTATQFNDRSRPEWPPHPARLFYAMVAAWADAEDPDPAERAALQWLERQNPPAITCSKAGNRAVVTHFVPVNDPTALTRDISGSYAAMAGARKALQEARQSADDRAAKRALTALASAEVKAVADAARVGRPSGAESGSVTAGVLQVLPDTRGKQGRTYPTVLPDDPAVWFAWPNAMPTADQFRVLDGLLARVGRIGHSSTLVTCRAARQAPSPTWIPTGGPGDTWLRVPRAGLTDRLERAFGSHQGEEPRVLPAGTASYRPLAAPRQAPHDPLLGGDWLVLEFSGRRLPSASRVLDIARAVRGALLSHGDQPPQEILSGHRSRSGAGNGSTPPLDRPHLAVVPLPNAGHARSDGTVFGVALILPLECSAGDRAAVEQAVRAWQAAGFRLDLPAGSTGGPLALPVEDCTVERAAGAGPSWLIADLASRRRTITRWYWCAPATRWLTVTPIALDRFPGNLRSTDSRIRDRAEAEAEASIARACVYAGLPEPSGVAVRLDAPVAGIPAAPAGLLAGSRPPGQRFPGYQTGSGGPRACVHAEIDFSADVRGPVLIGAGRYFGYGLCIPERQ